MSWLVVKSFGSLRCSDGLLLDTTCSCRSTRFSLECQLTQPRTSPTLASLTTVFLFILTSQAFQQVQFIREQLSLHEEHCYDVNLITKGLFLRHNRHRKMKLSSRKVLWAKKTAATDVDDECLVQIFFCCRQFFLVATKTKGRRQ